MLWSSLVSDNINETACATTPEYESVVSLRKNFFDRIVINLFSFICFFCAVALTLIICVATFFRYILEGNLYGYEEWVKILAFWLYFMGAAVGAYNRTHIRADLVNAYLSDGKFKDFMKFLRDLITFSVAGLFAWYGYIFFMFGFMGPLGTGIAIPMTSVWRIPMWIGYLSVFLGLVFMVYYFGRDFVFSARALFRRKKR